MVDGEHEEARLSPAPRRTRERKWGRNLPLGRVFADSFAILIRFAVPILFVVIVCTAGITLLELHSTTEFKDHPTPVDAWADAPAHGISILADVMQYVMAYFLQGMLTFIVLQHLRGRSPDTVSAIVKGFSRTVGALPLALVMSIVVGLLIAASSVVGFLTSIPAAVIQCGWFVAVPVAVAERASMGQALSRSWTLTSRSKWRIFMIQLVFGLTGAVLMFVFFFNYMSAPARENDYESLRTALIIGNAVMIPFIALLAISAPVAYHHLRHAKEGVDVETLAEVFD